MTFILFVFCCFLIWDKMSHSSGQYSGDHKWCLLRRYSIKVSNKPYLIRWIIFKTPIGGLMVHKFLSSDVDKELHNHPFPFITFVIKNGYTEEYYENEEKKTRVIQAPNIRFNPSGHTHRVTINEDKKPISIVLRGPKVREWGFFTECLTPKGIVKKWEHWKDFAARDRDWETLY